MDDDEIKKLRDVIKNEINKNPSVTDLELIKIAVVELHNKIDNLIEVVDNMNEK